MASPVTYGKQATVFMDEEFDEVKKIMKEGANEVLNKTSAEAKEVFKKQAEVAIEKGAGCVTTPCKTANKMISPEPVANIVNQSIDYCGAPISKRVANHLVDKSIDSAAKKMLDRAIDYSVNSTKSFFVGMYNLASVYFSKAKDTDEESQVNKDTVEDMKETIIEESKN